MCTQAVGKLLKRYAVRVLLFLAGIFLLLLNTWHHIKGVHLNIPNMVWNSQLGYVAIVLMIMSIIDISRTDEPSVKRLTLKKKINEADNVLQHFRRLILPIARLSVMSAIQIRRWSNPANKIELVKLQAAIESELVKIDRLRSHEVTNVFKEYHLFNQFDLAQPVFQTILEKLKNKIKKLNKILESYPSPVVQDERWIETIAKRNKTQEMHDEVKRRKAEFDFDNFRETIQSLASSQEVFDENEKKELFNELIPRVEKVEYYQKYKRFPEEEGGKSGLQGKG